MSRRLQFGAMRATLPSVNGSAPDAWRKPAMRKLCLTPVIVAGGFWLAGAFALDYPAKTQAVDDLPGALAPGVHRNRDWPGEHRHRDGQELRLRPPDQGGAAAGAAAQRDHRWARDHCGDAAAGVAGRRADRGRRRGRHRHRPSPERRADRDRPVRACARRLSPGHHVTTGEPPCPPRPPRPTARPLRSPIRSVRRIRWCWAPTRWSD